MDTDALRQKLKRCAAINDYGDADPAPITRGELNELLDEIDSLNRQLAFADELKGIVDAILDDAEDEVRSLREVAEELCRAAQVAPYGTCIGFTCPDEFDNAVRLAYRALMRGVTNGEDAVAILARVQKQHGGVECPR